ncbi:unnamed protein product [Arctia plantaginis]|uniref:CHK kinase-like domain-containing protein n=1 Tax=Arctia plantaginis TaxID=874455 RepID=A0A8S1AEZ1_ARCPL|nr:unnamed protein product [Arctia plantaginis]
MNSSDICDEKQDITDNCDEKQDITDNCDEKQDITDNCNEKQDITDNCDEKQDITDKSDEKQDITDNCDEKQDITDDCDEKKDITKDRNENKDIINECDQEMAREKINKLLKETVKTLNTFKYDLKIQEVSSGGANYTSNLYKVQVVPESGKEELKLFVKIACPSVNFRNTLKEWKIYTTEEFFYTKLLTTFKTIEDLNKVRGHHKLVFCKYYGCNSVVYEEMLVLEDLTANNWMVYDRFKPITWPYAKAAVTELAKFHSLSFAFSEKEPVEFKEVLERLKTQMNDESMSSFVKSSTSVALQSVKQENQERLKKYFEDFETKVKQASEPIGRSVIGHGDFRPSNLMHKIKEDGTVDIRIVDLQTLQGACPVADLLYFIFTGSDEEFRSLYYDRLVDHYYTELEAALIRLHLDPEKVYSRADFDFEIKEKLPYGLTVAVFALPVVTVSVENAPKIDEDMELAAFTTEKASDMYVERLNGVVDDFVKWGLFE